MLKIIFLSTVALLYVPVNHIPYTNVAPINIVLLLYIGYFLMHINTAINNRTNTITAIMLLFIVFSFTDLAYDYLFGHEYSKIFSQIRIVFIVYVFLHFITDMNRYVYAYKYIIILMLVSTVFGGILIYYIGEPFQSIRDWIVNQPKAMVLGKGYRIGGYTGGVVAFSYLVSAAPVMAFGTYLAEKKSIWLIFLGMLLVGLVLNGERAAALAAVLGIGMLSYKYWRIRSHQIIVVAVAVSCMLTIAIVKTQLIDNKLTMQSTLLDRMDEGTGSEIAARFGQQAAGALTVIQNPLTGAVNKQYYENINYVMESIFGSSNSGVTVKHSYRGQQLIAPHNHYVNIGMHVGVLGWVIFYFFVSLIIKVIRRFNKAVVTDMKFKIYFHANLYAFLAVAGNAIFHNNGLFFAETTSWVVLALIFAGSSVKDRRVNGVSPT